jgi:hypothetical protein
MNASTPGDLEFDCFFISHRESNCETNWQKLLTLHPQAKRIHGITGIDRAHLACDALSSTTHYWTVDGDNHLLQPLSFCPQTDLHLFLAKDPVFGDHTALGGVKLWRQGSIIRPDMSQGDFCLNATAHKSLESQCFSESLYNQTPFDAWKTAFRHCVKLHSVILVGRPHAKNLDHYRARWASTENLPTLTAEWCHRGYVDAKTYVANCGDDFIQLGRINDYDFLKDLYHAQYHGSDTNTATV